MNAGGPILLLAAGAALVFYSTGAGASLASGLGGGESDVSGAGLLSAFSGQSVDLGSYGGGMNQNRQAFLSMTALSELGAGLIAVSDNGYNVLVGATAANPLTFGDYSAHPDILNKQFDSTAAGRYQINFPTFKTLRGQTGLSDFSPSTQDAMAIQLCANKGALDDIDAGNFASAVAKCSTVWASFAGSPYGQRTNSLDALASWYQQNGGVLA